jgi:hypothetical protein
MKGKGTASLLWLTLVAPPNTVVWIGGKTDIGIYDYFDDYTHCVVPFE